MAEGSEIKRAKGENEFKEEEYLVRDKKQKEGRQRKTGTRQNKGENIKGNLKVYNQKVLRKIT